MMRVREWFATDLVLMPNSDGRLMPLDEWEGYDPCMRPGCGHYRCEHSMGEVWEATYVNSELKDPPFKMGDVVSWPKGCMNGGCKCGEFWTTVDLIAFVNKLNSARINGSYDLEQVPGVIHVDSDVEITVRIDTYTDSREEAARDAIYLMEQELYTRHPKVLFDFHTRWDKPKD